jgi:hypothetical protein
MEYYLICTNPKCRYIVNLREGAQTMDRSKLIIAECPECGSAWSSQCPSCTLPLKVAGLKLPLSCAHCGNPLKA